jgi:hypothetical protein
MTQLVLLRRLLPSLSCITEVPLCCPATSCDRTLSLSLSLCTHILCPRRVCLSLSAWAISMRREGILCCGGRSCRLNDAHGKVRKVRSTQASSSRRSHVQRSPHFASLPLILPPFSPFFFANFLFLPPLLLTFHIFLL